ncbi:MAG: Gfo/Idh/MocA family oxidoreductase [Phycisphaeraceae bacterium]|nr:Gfo/Idh/MocA family oxidoreductase [Phycisphaeraceae bacterium]
MPEQLNSLSRRRLLAGACAAAIAPTMLTGRSWAQATANNQIGVLSIGSGKRGPSTLMNYFMKDKAFRVVALAEVDQTRLDNHASVVNKFNGANDCRTAQNYLDLLDSADIDVVVINTPDHWHTIPAMQAALLGKHVYAEKPLTLNLRESQQIIRAQQKHNITFQTGSQQRTEYRGVFATAVEYVLNGRLGKVELAECGCGDPARPCDLPTEDIPEGLDWNLWQGPAPERGYHPDLSPRGVHKHYPAFRRYEEYAGGMLADFGAHMFDIAQWGMGKDRESPVRVIPPKDPKAVRGVEMIYADGKKIVHAPGPYQTKFIGELGSITVGRKGVTSEPASILQEPLTDSDIRLPRFKNHGVNFRDCIGKKQQPVCDVEVGSRTAALCHLANIAYDVQEELAFDPENWAFKGSEAANAKLDYGERRKGFELPEID